MTLKLVPLRIPTGWIILKNSFTETNPDNFNDEKYEHIWEFKEDILQLRNKNLKRIVDLGWYPAHKAEGQYCLVLVDTSEANDEGSFYWKEIDNYRSRNINEITTKIEDLLNKVNQGEL
ncbi:hypothetical protein [Paenibacillus sp. SYP-B4298]|uniref:hypothetical protein n=1 Tax=Paenibacillus sp. SYP-B4298 TaxID=2996034 RepID=UPI0022DE5D4E|nr:hypothetical protein [Paenibacillus sp. SYP-B4298]